MDKTLSRKTFIAVCVLSLCHLSLNGFSEGTKQIRPTASTFGALIVESSYTDFATYAAQPNYRLYIHVSTASEVIMFGLHRSSVSNRTYQLKAPDGTTVLTGLCPNTPTDSGYIANYAQAVIGPFFTSGGYHPLKYAIPPGGLLGDYYIQFSNSITFDLFDFQVVNGVLPVPIPTDTINGRVFSQSWQFSAGLAPFEPFSGNLYVYSDDGITTLCKYNAAHVGTFTMFCNQFGCLNTGNFSSDRQSNNSNTSNSFPGIAQYKVFFNNPDITVYPDGVYGAMTGAPTYPYIADDPMYPICSGRKLIYIQVNKTGNVDIYITFPYGSPATDVHLYSVVNSGVNIINWNGKDGTGASVPDGTQFNLSISYVNGLTNLPLWDIERNPEGFEISLIRPISPSGQTPLTFWDDSQLVPTGGSQSCPAPPTGTELTGCTPGSIPGVLGCHPWVMTGQDCHNKMINTWWYSASSSTATLTAMQIVTPPPPVIIGNFDRCGPGVVNLVALVLNTEIVRWYDQPTGGTLLGTSNSGAPFAQTINTTGTFHFYAEAYNPTPPYFCTSDTRTDIAVNVIPIPAPPLQLSPPYFSCGSGTVTLNAVPLLNISVEWYDAAVGGNLLGTGNSFTTPVIAITTTYYAQAVDIGFINQCTSATRTAFLAEIRPVPHVTNTPATKQICSSDNTNITLLSDVSGTNFTWTSTVTAGAVTIINNSVQPGTLINDQLINTGTADGIVRYSITPHASSCDGPTVDFFVTVHPVPHLTNNPASKTICSSASTNITLVSDVTGTSFTWSSTVTSGTVTIINNSTQPGTLINDQLINTGITDGIVKYSITPLANNCSGPVVDYLVTVHPVPHLMNSPASTTICSSANTNITLAFDVAGTDFTWTSAVTAGTVTINNNSTQPGLLINDQLVNTGNVDGIVTYTITPHANSCDGPPLDYSVTVHPHAIVNPVTTQIICSGTQTASVPLSSNVTTLTVDYSWTVSCDPGIPVCPGSGNSNTIPPTAISNTDMVPRFATYSITPSVAGCPGTLATYTVQVNPSPTVTTSPLSQQICTGTSSTLVVLTANVSGTTFAWTTTPSSGAISGYQVAPGSGDIPVQTITNSSAVQGYVNYHIIPSSQSGMACPGAPADYKIYVNPLPAPVISGQQQVCYDQSGITYSTPFAAGHDYIWTVTGDVSFTGNHTNSITVDWGPGPSGTVQLTEVDQNFPTNCSNSTPVFNVIINPAPTPVITGPGNPCGQTTQVYSIGASQPNHAYLWTVAGGSPASGTNPSISVTWGNSNPVSLDILESVTYAPGVVCTAHAPAFPVSLILIPDAAGAISGPASTCQGLTQTYSVGSIANADSYTWTYLPSTGVTITNNGPSADLHFDFTSLSGNLTVMGNKTACASGPVSPPLAVTVYTPPFTGLTICFDPVTTTKSKPFILKGGVPLGGQYYIDGNPAPGGIFDPSVLSASIHNITYSFSDFHGCSATTPAVQVSVIAGSNPGSCAQTFTDPRDSHTYKAFALGAHCWMLSNLAYGTIMPSAFTPQTDNCTPEKYCLASDPSCLVYGGLYQWDEIMQYQAPAPGQTVQGLCPPEWHLPSVTEWQDLINAVANMVPGEGVAGDFLKDPNPVFGFHALLEGIFYLNNTWAFTSGNLTASMYWTSTISGGSRAIARGLNNYNYSVSFYPSSRANSFSVRCVKD